MVDKLNALSELRECLSKPDIMIVGSLALHLHGFEVEVNDVDIEISIIKDDKPLMSYPLAQKLELLQQANPLPEANNSLKQDSDRRFDFVFKGVKFNIWVKYEGESIHKTFTYYNYCKVAGVLTVLEYIKSFGRSKDLLRINNIASQILNYSK